MRSSAIAVLEPVVLDDVVLDHVVLENLTSVPASSTGLHLVARSPLNGKTGPLTLVKTTGPRAIPIPIRQLEAPWTERDCVALALVTCNRCFGAGSYPSGLPGRLTVCNCVLRAVFRACYEKWRNIAKDQLDSRIGSAASSRIGSRRTGRRAWFWARPSEEYRADFELIARRTLDASHYAIFRLHFLDELDWRVCCKRLGIDRGNFYHSVYRIQERLGRAYREAAPYALFPVYDYFSIAA
ncbi:MAG: hypothetical protein JOZ32_17375 [Bryobacterales bacterium]|nr:hypothetical protein [Bryobacterales bacterium]